MNKIELIKRLRDLSVTGPSSRIVVETNDRGEAVLRCPQQGIGLKEAKDFVEEIMYAAINEYLSVGHDLFRQSNGNFHLNPKIKGF